MRSQPDLIAAIAPEASLQAVLGASGFIPAVMIAVPINLSDRLRFAPSRLIILMQLSLREGERINAECVSLERNGGATNEASNSADWRRSAP